MDAQFQRQVGAVIAFAQVYDTHDGAMTVTLNRGFASVAHVTPNSGVYDLTLDAGMTGPNQTTADLVVVAQFGEDVNFPGFITRQWLDAQTLRLTVWGATGVEDDAPFDVKVIRATNHE